MIFGPLMLILFIAVAVTVVVLSSAGSEAAGTPLLAVRPSGRLSISCASATPAERSIRKSTRTDVEPLATDRISGRVHPLTNRN